MIITLTNHQLTTDTGVAIALPELPVESTVRVWTVPTDYQEQGLFVSTTPGGQPIDIPACDHGEPVFEAALPAHPAAVLRQAKEAKNMQINGWRLQANQSTFPYAGKVFACDILSRSDIDGVANSINLSGQFPPGFPNAWKAVDNSYLPIATPKEFINFYQAMTAQGAANFARAQVLKQQLALAVTIEEVNAVNW